MASTATASAPSVAAPAPRRVVPILNPANAVTASRFLTLPFLWWAVAHGYHQWATLFIFTCAILDKVDGLVARVFDCKSAFGELFDAIADGVCFGFGLVLVTAYGWAPLGSVSVIVSLGVLNTVMRFIYIKRAGRTTNYKSYAMERIVAFTAFQIGFATSGMAEKVPFFYWTFAPIMLLTVLYDAKRMLIDPIDPIRPAARAAP
jgi:phosphatidylglycerophosphate synthase